MASTTDGHVVWMWVDSVGLLDFRSSRSLLGLMASLLSFPSQPVTDGPAHDQFEVPALQPGKLFREQRRALTPRARHARDVGAPGPPRRPSAESPPRSLRSAGRPALLPATASRRCRPSATCSAPAR